jgi:hypothetical protein
VKCEADEEDDKPSSGRRQPPKRSRKPLGWLREVLASVRSQKSMRVVVNVIGLLVLMRFWPLSGRNPLTGEAATVSVEVRTCPLSFVMSFRDVFNCLRDPCVRVKVKAGHVSC